MRTNGLRATTLAALLAFVCSSVNAAAALSAEKETSKPAKAPTDSTMKLHGGEEGTIFKSLRIEGEDRVRIEFDRPALNVDLDARSAPGLDWEGIHTVLNRQGLDLLVPFLARTASERPTHFARPWLDGMSTESVARFRPSVEGVDRWRLVVADSHGETVATFEGKGKPPKEIAWDGRSVGGKPVPPGLTYSYVLEAFDRAGNKRNFVGDGFELPSYRIRTPGGLTMLFAGEQLHGAPARPGGGPSVPPALLLEAASWINQGTPSKEKVVVEVTARTFDEASRLAERIARDMQPLLLGDPLRVQTVTHVQEDAPARGTVAITVSR